MATWILRLQFSSSHFIRDANDGGGRLNPFGRSSHFAICAATRSSLPTSKLPATAMNAHTRFALPVNTHGNLKYLHDKAQENADINTAKTDRSDVALTSTKQRRESSSAKFSQKMKMLFPGKKLQEKSTLSDEEEAERKRSTMSQLVGSHSTVQMCRR